MISAIEYMDARALRAVPDDAFTRVGVERPTERRSVLLMAQIEVESDEGATFERLQDVLDSCGVSDEATVAAPDDERGAQRLFELREAVPSSVNALVAAAKGNPDFAVQWAGQGAPLARELPAAELVATLVSEANL